MRAGFSRLNPTFRGFLILVAVAVVIAVLQLQMTLVALLILARVAFILAIAVFVFLLWRERRTEIAQWPLRARVVFYGSAALALADLGANWYGGAHGVQIVAFIGVLALCGFAMFRTWRDQHTYV